MLCQISCLAKGLVTMLAFKWLPTSVCSFVFFQISCLAKSLVTLFTLKWLLTSVYSFMSFQISHHSKRLVILFALNRLLTSVSSFMYFQISWWWVNSSSECLHLTLLSCNVLISLSLDQYIKASFWDFPVMTEWTRLCISQIEALTSPPGIWLFWILSFKFPPPRAKMLFKCPTLGSIRVMKCPHPGDISQAHEWRKDGKNAFSCRTKSL